MNTDKILRPEPRTREEEHHLIILLFHPCLSVADDVGLTHSAPVGGERLITL